MYTFDADLFSDLHKDVYGFRPRNHTFYSLCDSDPAEAQAIWDSLLIDLERENAFQEEHHQECVQEYEDHIQDLIKLGAEDRETAIRWIIDEFPEEDQYLDCISWNLNLSSTQIKELEDVLCQKVY
jgi:hypothetical protein